MIIPVIPLFKSSVYSAAFIYIYISLSQVLNVIIVGHLNFVFSLIEKNAIKHLCKCFIFLLLNYFLGVGVLGPSIWTFLWLLIQVSLQKN